mgnify:CR=1 FL=1
MKRKRTPSLRQVKTLQLMSQGYTKHRAMKEAGYSASSLKQGKRIIDNSPAVRNYVNQVYPELIKLGIDAPYEANKIKEWLEAKKPFSSHTEPDKMVDDFEIQIKAYDRLQQLKPTVNKKGIKRKLTIEEFITEGGEPNSQ